MFRYSITYTVNLLQPIQQKQYYIITEIYKRINNKFYATKYYAIPPRLKLSPTDKNLQNKRKNVFWEEECLLRRKDRPLNKSKQNFPAKSHRKLKSKLKPNNY